jgi:uroporphyrinogen-III decarboxylase
VISRSPFGKLVHEYLGFDKTIYALADYEDEVCELLEFIEEHDLKIIEMAADAPCKLVIISDHADENLISPRQYRDYCIPYYQKACGILHRKGKFVSTHLDGNIKGYLPILGDTGFDLLDGCTPHPMFNYLPEELAAAPGRPACYLGIPATLFVTDTPVNAICDFGLRIAAAFGRKVIVNVGDILPPNGDIEKVIAAGKALCGA